MIYNGKNSENQNNKKDFTGLSKQIHRLKLGKNKFLLNEVKHPGFMNKLDKLKKESHLAFKRYISTDQKLVFLAFFIIYLIVFILGDSHLYGQQLAFPGAEGYGRFTTGGRGGKVFEVTNLNDSGPGSLRAAVAASGPRTVVFRISGTIRLKARLTISNGDITIAGQTAPGDGICIADYDVSIDASNVIIRYLRFRLGDIHQLEADAISGRYRTNIIIDHCSMSWSIDETASFYDNENFTMQWCLISESLYNSYHSKGAHGYGGIWGGMGASFHHNLLAHHSSRNPRFQGSRDPASTPETEIVDHRNNVIFNWGGNSAYGGEQGNQNMIANYYISGPATHSITLRYRIVEPSSPYGKWYITDNYVAGYPEVTADNWNDGVQGVADPDDVRVDEPFPFAPVLTHTAENAYLVVLEDVGASLPKRDSVDLRIIEEVRTGTTTYGGTWGAGEGIIDSQDEVGGWPTLNSLPAPTDNDQDGMANDWELAHELDPSDPEDRNGDFNGDGYTNLEKYLSFLCERPDFVLAPAELSASVISYQEIVIKWSEISINETGFSIERSMDDTTNFVEIGTVGPNDTVYYDSGLEEATTYYYRVRAFNNQVYSIYSNIDKEITLNESGIPLPVTNPQPADSTTGIKIPIRLKWQASIDATSFDVYAGTTNPPPFRVNQTATEYDLREIQDSTLYYWRIDAVNNIGTTTGQVWQFITESFTPAIVAYWPLDRGFGTLAIDATGNRNYAYLINITSTAWIDGVLGKALEFDGIDDYLRVNNEEIINFSARSFTINFWLRQDQGDITAPWISKGDFMDNTWGRRYEIGNDANGKVVFIVIDDTDESRLETANTDFVTGNWVMVTAIRDRVTFQIKLYLNAQLVEIAQDSTWDISHKADLLIAGNAAQEKFLKGALDEVRLLNYAADTTEIEEFYQVGTTGIDLPDLVWIPRTIELNNYPNPFNNITIIRYAIPKAGNVNLTIYNTLGQKVTGLVNEERTAGIYTYHFNAATLSSGIYFSRLETEDKVKIRKMLLMK